MSGLFLDSESQLSNAQKNEIAFDAFEGRDGRLMFDHNDGIEYAIARHDLHTRVKIKGAFLISNECLSLQAQNKKISEMISGGREEKHIMLLDSHD